MKKTLALVLAVLMAIFAFTACDIESSVTIETDGTTEIDVNAKDEGVLTYAQYIALEKDQDCVIEGFIQAVTSYSSWGNCCIYLADGDGAYYVYRYTCTEDEYKLLVVGAKVKVEGIKSEWAGEVEVAAASENEPIKVTVVGTDSYVAAAQDVTSLFGTDDLQKKNNCRVTVKGAVVTSSSMKNPEDSSATLEKAFLYNYDGSGEQGSDVYFNVKVGENEYTFVVETDLADKTTEVYKAVEALNIGDTVDLEGFLYWYEGAQVQVTGVTKK